MENNNSNTGIHQNSKAHIISILNEVNDPEIPVLNIFDLGIVRDVVLSENGLSIIITPTYSGCPAMDAITLDIKLRLAEAGYRNVKVESVLSPAWTTEWMSEEGKKKLIAYGIAPPKRFSLEHQPINCTQWNSSKTKVISQFGSTACKALYQCKDCLEFFDSFKCH